LTSSQPNPTDAARLVSLTNEEAVKEILGATVLDLWKVVNNLTRLRPSKRERYRVAIFGSARAKPGTYVYDEVKRAAAAFAALGCDIVTGGGPGLMQAANEGAKEAGALESVGIRVELPFEQDVNPFVEQAFEHETFFTRLHHFVIASDAFVVVPGGIGAVLEMLMIPTVAPNLSLEDRQTRGRNIPAVLRLHGDAPVEQFARDAECVSAYRMKSFDRNVDDRFDTIDLMIARLASVSFAATSVRIVNTRSASLTDNVPSAEAFRPVNGKVSGPRWH
jgi:uncharacterized protein (TIGR00725 family)